MPKEELKELAEMLSDKEFDLTHYNLDTPLSADSKLFLENYKTWKQEYDDYRLNPLPSININGNNNIVTIAANQSTAISNPSPIRECTIIPNYILETIIKLKKPIDQLDLAIIYSIGKRLYNVDGRSFPSLNTIAKECGGCDRKTVANRLKVLSEKEIFKIKEGTFNNTLKKKEVNNYEWF